MRMKMLFPILTLLVLWISTVFCARAFPSPVGLWMFDKQYEGKDLSGNGNDAMFYGTEWMSGPFGTPSRAVKVTGADDQSSRIEIPNDNGVLSVTYSFTWMTWFVDLDSSRTGPIYSMGAAQQWGHIFFKCCPDGSGFHPRFDQRPNGGNAWDLQVASFFTQDTWTRVAVTYDQPNGVVKVYQDGEERTDLRSSYSGLLDDDHNLINIGAISGYSDEITAGLLCTMYYNVALTQEELSAASSMCFPNEYKSLYPWPHALAHWPMNSYHGINNAADGRNKDGIAQYYSVENGPYGEPGGSYLFRQSFDSWGEIDNGNGLLDVNSFTFTAWFKPGNGNGPIFRIWEDAAGDTSAPHIWKHSDETQLYYAHYSETDGAVKGTVSSDTGVLQIRKWNYIAVVYNYGTGKSYLYANDVMVKSYDHGSHPTKMGPVLSMMEYGNPNHLYARDSAIGCVQWHNMPLSEYSLLRVKNECKTSYKGYKPQASLLFPLSRGYELRELSATGRLAVSSEDSYIWKTGPRNRPYTSLELAQDQTVTFPALQRNSLSSFTFAVHFKLNTSGTVHLVDGLIQIDDDDIVVSLGGTDYKHENITTTDWVWFGVTYDGYLGVLTVYSDGDPVESRFVGHHTITLNSVKLDNEADSSGNLINCYQFYEEALNLRQFVYTRDACIIYTDETSLPYPRGFWPLTAMYELREVTGRSPDLIDFSQGQITFDVTGPYGDSNGAMHLDPNIKSAILYADRHKGLNVKFSWTFSGWIKIASSFADNQRSCIIAYRYIDDAEEQNHGDVPSIAGSLLCVWGKEGEVVLYSRAESINGYVTHPETSGLHYFTASQYRQPKDKWIHVAATYDFDAKVTNLFVNGEFLQYWRFSRHIQKTDLTMMVGSILDYDTDDSITSMTHWKSDQDMSCLQLYDVALTEVQVKRSMDLCKPGALDSVFSANVYSKEGKSLSNPQDTVTHNSRLDCVRACEQDSTCTQAAYGSSECDLDTRSSAELGQSDYESSSDFLLEKDHTPWQLFV